MNWLTNFVRPKIRAIVGKKEVPDNLWTKCPSCEQLLFHRDLKINLFVCNNCGFHLPIEPLKRLESLFDDGKYSILELPDIITDPLRFKDTKRYTDRLKENRNKTNHKESIIVTEGKINNINTTTVVQNFNFMGGSMGLAVGEALIKAAQNSVNNRTPLVIFSAAGGARMQEGILSLMQMPRTVIAIDLVKEAKLPYISIFTNPTTGGVTASYAMLGDISIAEPGALIGFAGPRVIKDTIREELPEGFQTSEYLLDHGMIDMVLDRREIRDKIITILKNLYKEL
ncbi:acetyl-CoA carboxylase, carboxyltransferase subunit beta [Alphaproteobacteria bacterium]|nr:acetyl-CoA carboxylase, carboxyltransferase subunit beta [Alphaproteobacteria bacterium]